MDNGKKPAEAVMDSAPKTCYTVYKKYEDLKFSDNFLFHKVMMSSKSICIGILERILDVEIKDIKYIQSEKIIDPTSVGKSIRLDVYVNDDKGTIFDVEMQTTDTGELPQRSRFYQSMIDQELLERGDGYADLRKSYVIFICMFDPFGRGLGKYTFRNRADEDTGVCLGDDAVKVFVNSRGRAEYRTLQNLLNYISGAETDRSDSLIKDLEKACMKASENPEWRAEYMRMNWQEGYLKKRAKEEGALEEKIRIIKELLERGYGVGTIAGIVDLPEEEVRNISSNS